MIEFTTYEGCDIDEDPILVLPCGHFYTMSTLDGIFDMTQAYDIGADGEYIALKPLLRSDDVKPKCCPDCRSVVHSVGRYGRLLSFLRLRFLERKHLIALERSLKACAYHLSQDDTDSSKIVGSLQRILKDIKNGPTQKVFEACGGSNQIDVPAPATKPVIQALQLLGRAYSRQIKESDDESYQQSVGIFTEAICICEDTRSFYLGAETRISLARLQLRWNAANAVGDKVNALVDPILTNEVLAKFTEICKQAKELKQQIESSDTFIDVVRAMNAHDGYNYGGSWSSYWYECPNGHPYFIGECGGAMQTAACIECGERIGGESHTLLSSNRQSEAVRRVLDRS